MSKKHDAVFDAVLSGLPETPDRRAQKSDKSAARFLKRSTALSERASGDLEEKTLRWVDPEECEMWDRHNREYDLLTPENCADLIDGIKAQGRQEFPAIVRTTQNSDKPFEVICGARRHFAVSWLRANNYPQFKYLVEVRDLSDEEAFRLADVENRDREDISDFERARDYAQAIDLYYGGKQKLMAERLEVSEAWLSRNLQLAKLPEPIIAAFASIHDIKELHARTLKPLLADPAMHEGVLARAAEMEERQIAARAGTGTRVEAAQVVAFLKKHAKPAVVPKASKIYRGKSANSGIKMSRGRGKTLLEVPDSLLREDLEAALRRFLLDRYAQ